MDKSLLKNEEVLSTTFPTLNIIQIEKIIDQISPDKVSFFPFFEKYFYIKFNFTYLILFSLLLL